MSLLSFSREILELSLGELGRLGTTVLCFNLFPVRTAAMPCSLHIPRAVLPGRDTSYTPLSGRWKTTLHWKSLFSVLDPRTAVWELRAHQWWPLEQQHGDSFLLCDTQGPSGGGSDEEPHGLAPAARIWRRVVQEKYRRPGRSPMCPVNIHRPDDYGVSRRSGICQTSHVFKTPGHEEVASPVWMVLYEDEDTTHLASEMVWRSSGHFKGGIFQSSSKKGLMEWEASPWRLWKMKTF